MVLVAGTGMTAFNRRKDGSGFRDWVAEAFQAALTESQIDRGDIDALVVSSESDFFSMQINPASVLADDLGLHGVACQRVEAGGASGQTAVQSGAALVLSGVAQRVAVVGFEPSASYLGGAVVTDLYGYSFDVWTDGMSGVSSTALYALSAKAFMARSGATEEDFAMIAVQNRTNARSNPHAHLPLEVTVDNVRDSPVVSDPYRRLDCSPVSDGAAAVILTSKEKVPASRHGAARIAGIGAANDRVRLGDRPDAGFFAGKQSAAKRAYAMAGITKPDRQIELAEIYDAYSGAQLQGIEALGLSQDTIGEHRAGGFAPTGRLPVNLSGGLLGQGAPVGATGIAQVIACARQIEGSYHADLQVNKLPRFAVADTHGGVATTCAVTVLEAVGN